MVERELIKIKSDNPAHPLGYFTQFKDRANSGDVVFDENAEIKDAKMSVAVNNRKVKNEP